MKSSPYFWLALHRTKVRWRFRKILWPSQNIWTLTKAKSFQEAKFHKSQNVEVLFWIFDQIMLYNYLSMLCTLMCCPSVRQILHLGYFWHFNVYYQNIGHGLCKFFLGSGIWKSWGMDWWMVLPWRWKCQGIFIRFQNLVHFNCNLRHFTHSG